MVSKPILDKKLIKVGLESKTKGEALEMGGKLLVKGGYVTEEYINHMKEREKQMSTFAANGLAIPHGTEEAKENIKHSGISVLQFPKGIDYGGGNTAYLVVSIAGKKDEHLSILKNLATLCQEEEKINQLVAADKEEIYNKLSAIEGE